ncbi:MAG: hypothetical protein ACM3QY_08400, partial [Candidatus Levyibacteriota bacterium]
DIAARWPAAGLRASLAIPYTLLRERSLARARMAYEYLTQDATRVFPAAAFEETGASLLRLGARGAAPGDGRLAAMLARDLESLVLVRIPQFPSSRRFGTAPVVGPDEYRGVVPGNPEDMQIVPVPPRPFPRELRDLDLLPPPRNPSDVPLAVWLAVAALALLAAVAAIAAACLRALALVA